MDGADWLLAEGDTAPSDSSQSFIPILPSSAAAIPYVPLCHSLNSMASSCAQVSQSCCVYSTSLRTWGGRGGSLCRMWRRYSGEQDGANRDRRGKELGETKG